MVELKLPLLPEYDNSSVGEEEHFEMRHFMAALTDWQVNSVSGFTNKGTHYEYEDLDPDPGVHVYYWALCVSAPYSPLRLLIHPQTVYGISLFLP